MIQKPDMWINQILLYIRFCLLFIFNAHVAISFVDIELTGPFEDRTNCPQIRNCDQLEYIGLKRKYELRYLILEPAGSLDNVFVQFFKDYG